MIYGGKLANQKHLAAIRDAFATLIPLIIAGSFAVLINSIFIEEWGLIADFSNLTEAQYAAWENVSFYISPIFNLITDATLGAYSIYMAFLLGYFLSGSYGNDKLFGGLIGLAGFLLLNPFAAGSSATEFLGTSGLLVSILIGLVAPTIYNVFVKFDKLKIGMPASVPQAVTDAFNQLFPVLLTVLVLASFQPIWGAIAFTSGIGGYTNSDGVKVINENYYIIAAINTALGEPLLAIGDSLPFVMIGMFMMAFLFWFGIHGPNVVGAVVNPIWTATGLYNVDLYSTYGNQAFDTAYIEGLGLQPLYTWTGGMQQSFILIGGTGATLGLIFLLYFFSKNKVDKKVSQISVGPGIFQVNEPVIFGLPIVLNPIWFVPFAFTSLVNSAIAYTFVSSGLMNPMVIVVPWTTPWLISGILSTLDPMSLLVSVITLGVTIVFWLPFVLLNRKQQLSGPEDQKDDKTMFQQNVATFKMILSDKEENKARKQEKKKLKEEKKAMKKTKVRFENLKNSNLNDSKGNKSLAKISIAISSFISVSIVLLSFLFLIFAYSVQSFKDYDLKTMYYDTYGYDVAHTDSSVPTELLGVVELEYVSTPDTTVDGVTYTNPYSVGQIEDVFVANVWNSMDLIEQKNFTDSIIEQIDNQNTDSGNVTYTSSNVILSENAKDLSGETVEGIYIFSEVVYNFDLDYVSKEYKANSKLVGWMVILIAVYTPIAYGFNKKNFAILSDKRELGNYDVFRVFLFGGVIPAIGVHYDKKNYNELLKNKEITNDEIVTKEENNSDSAIEKKATKKTFEEKVEDIKKAKKEKK